MKTYSISGDMTGKYSIYTLYEGHEIMFHVSTLLPFSRDNRQQVCMFVIGLVPVLLFTFILSKGNFSENCLSPVYI